MKKYIKIMNTDRFVPIPYRQKKIEKEEEEKKRIISGSDKYKYPGNDHIP